MPSSNQYVVVGGRAFSSLADLVAHHSQEVIAPLSCALDAASPALDVAIAGSLQRNSNVLEAVTRDIVPDHDLYIV